MNKWGHLKLKKVCISSPRHTHTLGEGLSVTPSPLQVLESHCSLPRGATPSKWPVVGQFSSVGSLGPSPSHWLSSEWLTSLSSSSSSSSSSSAAAAAGHARLKTLSIPRKLPPLKLVYRAI